MAFSVNHPILYLFSGIVVAFILAQSVYFLVKAAARARELGISGATIRKTVLSSALFSVAPAVSILVGVITLSQFIGLPYPWLRLSVLGAVTYELPAATIAASAMGAPVTQAITDARTFAVIAWVKRIALIARRPKNQEARRILLVQGMRQFGKALDRPTLLFLTRTEMQRHYRT